MTSSLSRSLSMLVAAVALSACNRGVSVSSPAPAPAPGSATATTARVNGLPAAITQAMIDSGKTLFAGASCAKCHGAGGAGGQNGPVLTDDKWVQIDGSYDAIVKIIHTGVPKASIKGSYPFTMRPLGGGNFSDDQVNMIAAYVYSISHK